MRRLRNLLIIVMATVIAIAGGLWWRFGPYNAPILAMASESPLFRLPSR